MYKNLAISFFHSTLPETPTVWATGRKNLGSSFCAFLHEVYLASNDSDIKDGGRSDKANGCIYSHFKNKSWTSR